MPADPQRVQAVFLAAIEAADPTARAALLTRECGDDAELRQRVDALLQAHDQSGSSLDHPAAEGATSDDVVPGRWIDPAGMPPAAEGPGSRIGPYKLLQQIGEGGMGVVYMAEQTEPVQRKVALKIIKAGMDSRHVLARFEAERQALALMDHPHIAKVLDAGATAQGRPYFVMELVKGQPITKYCDEHRLTPRERLELFVPVCQAIQHAHQKGLIHRDVKPSNVLVAPYDGRPVVKVIDFGVAKATGQRLTDKTLFTEFGAVVGTLEYMSPEQAELNNQDIDTRSDIYSLGVLLYELLTGTTPLDRARLRQAAFTELLRMIREEEPPKPSTRLSESGEALPSISAQRKTEPARLAKLVRGELDWIVMKALEKDRGRRYETANSFARDVQRYLADEPVEACPPSPAYRLRKFARKNRKALATACAFVLMLVAAAVASTWQAMRATRAETKARQAQALAEERFDLAKDAVDRYLNEVTETPELKNANFEQLRKKLLETALPFYQKLAEQAPGDPEREAARGGAYFRVAFIRSKLGEHAAALQGYRQARDIFARLAQEHPDVPDYRCNLADSHNNLADDLGKLGQLARAEAEHRVALKEQERLVAEHPKVPEYRDRLAGYHANLGLSLVKLGRRAEAEAELRAALKEHQRLVGDYPEVPDYRCGLAHSHNALGLALHDALGRWAEGAAEFRAALDEHQRLAKAYPDVPEYRLRLAEDLHNLGRALQSLGKPVEAEAEYRAALKEHQRLADEHPEVPLHRHCVAWNRQSLGGVLAGLGRWAEAEAEYQAAIKEHQRLAEAYPDVPEYRLHLAEDHHNLGLALLSLGKLVEAEAEYRAALKDSLRLVAERPNVPQYRSELALDHGNLGLLLAELGRGAEAETEYRAAIKEYQRLVGEYPEVPDYRHGLAGSRDKLGNLLGHLGQQAEAAVEHRAAIEEYQRLADEHPDVPDYCHSLAGSRHNLGNQLADLGRRGEAEAEYRAALKDSLRLVAERPKVPGYREFLANHHMELGRLLAKLGKRGEAEVEYVAAIKEYQRLADEHPDVPRYRESLAIAHDNLGNLLADLGKRGEAEAEYRAAIKEWQRLVAEHPNVPGYRRDLAIAHDELGIVLARKGDHDGAIREFQAAIRIDPNNAGAHCRLGWALEQKGDVAGAIPEYQAAIRINPKYAEAHICLGALLCDKKADYDGAIATFRAAIRLADDSALAHSNLGEALMHKGDLDGALREYRAAIQRDPTFPPAYENLGDVLLEQGHFAEALAAFKRSHELGAKDPRWPSASAQRVREVEQIVALEGKLPHLLQGEGQPADAAGWLALARCARYKKLHVAATGFYARAFAAQPERASDLDRGARYEAACAAALAGCGQGQDAAPLDAKERARLRGQALAWLRADLALRAKQVASGRPKEREAGQAGLHSWRRDRHLAGVRDDALDKLPAAEREAWRKFWADVADAPAGVQAPADAAKNSDTK
jgi:serine/threonine protein kinase/tetratricopeptide (TPR) repeat protein